MTAMNYHRLLCIISPHEASAVFAGFAVSIHYTVKNSRMKKGSAGAGLPKWVLKT